MVKTAKEKKIALTEKQKLDPIFNMENFILAYLDRTHTGHATAYGGDTQGDGMHTIPSKKNETIEQYKIRRLKIRFREELKKNLIEYTAITEKDDNKNNEIEKQINKIVDRLK